MTGLGIDFETANCAYASICAAGLAIFEDGILAESLYWLVRPPKGIRLVSGRLHRMSRFDMVRCPKRSQILRRCAGVSTTPDSRRSRHRPRRAIRRAKAPRHTESFRFEMSRLRVSLHVANEPSGMARLARSPPWNLGRAYRPRIPSPQRLGRRRSGRAHTAGNDRRRKGGDSAGPARKSLLTEKRITSTKTSTSTK
jgi:hypothetical protein